MQRFKKGIEHSTEPNEGQKSNDQSRPSAGSRHIQSSDTRAELSSSAQRGDPPPLGSEEAARQHLVDLYAHLQILRGEVRPIGNQNITSSMEPMSQGRNIGELDHNQVWLHEQNYEAIFNLFSPQERLSELSQVHEDLRAKIEKTYTEKFLAERRILRKRKL